MAAAASPHTPVTELQKESTQNVQSSLKLKETKRGKVYIGELPSSFLRLPAAKPTLQVDDSVIAQSIALQQQFASQSFMTDKINITIIEAKLNKNYGMTRMDPYCRVKIGQSVYETPTSQNGAKTPHWGKTVAVPVNPDVNTFHVDIYDERAFSGDNRIAWAVIKVPDSVKERGPLDDWWPLSGKLGEEKEGLIHLSISWQKIQQPMMYSMPNVAQMYNPAIAPQIPYYMTGAVPMPVGNPYQQQQQQLQVQATPQPQISDEDIKQVKEMFPKTEDEVIKAILEASRGNKDVAINSLLSMQC